MTRPKNGNGIPFRWWIACAALAFVPLVQAKTISKHTTGFSASSAGNTVTFGSATNAAPWATTPGATAATSGNIGFAKDGTVIWGQGSTKMPLPEGRTANVLVKAPMSNSAAAGAIGRFALKAGASAIGVAGVGLATWELLQDLGYVKKDGQLGYSEPAQAPSGFPYQHLTCESAARGGAPLNLCDNARVAHPDINVWLRSNNVPAGCVHRVTVAWDYHAIGLYCTPAPGQFVPVTEGDINMKLTQKIASESGWPSSGPGALAEAVQAGESLPHLAPTVSGPATVTGPTTTSMSTGPSGTTTTTTTNNYNLNYTGPTITVTTTTTSVTTGPDGTTTTTTDTESPPPDDTQKDEYDTPEEAVPTDEKNVSWSPMNLGFGSGSCPNPVTWQDTLGTHAIPFDKLCDVLSTIIRPLVLAMAALAAAFIILPRES